MLKVRFNLRKVVAIAICLAGSATMFAQDKTTDKGAIINGVKWATRNVDAPGTFADNSNSPGMLYQWGKKIGWSATDPLINSDGSTTWDKTPFTGDVWEKENDPCPCGWRVPTSAEINSLIDPSDDDELFFVNWVTLGGVAGKRFTAFDPINIFDYDNDLFFPATGTRESILDNGIIKGAGVESCYWSSTRNEMFSSDRFPVADYMALSKTSAIICHAYYVCALPIRCVAENGVNDVKDVSADTKSTIIGYFDLLGRKLKEEPAKGLYVILYDNGKTKKMMK